MKHYLHSLGVLSALAVAFPALAAEPVAPSGVTAASTEAGVVITWQPVTEDVDENPVDPDEVIYDVYRCDADDVKTKVAEDIVETTCTDVLGEITGEVFYRWQVIAKTADGSSSAYEGYSPLLGFGDGLPPLHRDFQHRKRLEHGSGQLLAGRERRGLDRLRR